MPSFTYESIGRDGAAATGTLSAPDMAEANRRLRERGLTPITVQETESTGLLATLRKRKGRPTVRRSELASLVRELGVRL